MIRLWSQSASLIESRCISADHPKSHDYDSSRAQLWYCVPYQMSMMPTLSYIARHAASSGTSTGNEILDDLYQLLDLDLNTSMLYLSTTKSHPTPPDSASLKRHLVPHSMSCLHTSWPSSWGNSRILQSSLITWSTCLHKQIMKSDRDHCTCHAYRDNLAILTSGTHNLSS